MTFDVIEISPLTKSVIEQADAAVDRKAQMAFSYKKMNI